MSESDDEVTVTLSVLTGDLSRDVVVEFDTVDVSATSTGSLEMSQHNKLYE